MGLKRVVSIPLDPSGNPAPARVKATLLGADSGYDGAGNVVEAPVYAAATTDGTGWALDLLPNDTLTPSGTAYTITETIGSIKRTHIIEVLDALTDYDPEDDPPVTYTLEEQLTDTPGALASAALSAHLTDGTPHSFTGFQEFSDVDGPGPVVRVIAADVASAAIELYSAAVGHGVGDGDFGAQLKLFGVGSFFTITKFDYGHATLPNLTRFYDPNGSFLFQASDGPAGTDSNFRFTDDNDVELFRASRRSADGFEIVMGFFGQAGTARPVITGSRDGNAALASLLTGLDGLGLVDDQTEP